MGSSADTLGKGLTTLLPALPPGSYTIELSHEGYRDKILTVRVGAGKTETIDVTLRPQ